MHCTFYRLVQRDIQFNKTCRWSLTKHKSSILKESSLHQVLISTLPNNIIYTQPFEQTNVSLLVVEQNLCDNNEQDTFQYNFNTDHHPKQHLHLSINMTWTTVPPCKFITTVVQNIKLFKFISNVKQGKLFDLIEECFYTKTNIQVHIGLLSNKNSAIINHRKFMLQ